MSDYSELKRLAEAATPGPWIAENSRHEGSINALDRHIGMVSMHAKVREDIPQNFANQAFIAATNPAAVLALIAENERLKKNNIELSRGVLRLGEYNTQRHAELSFENCQVIGERLAAEKERDQLKSELKSMTAQRDAAVDLAILRKRERNEATGKVDALKSLASATGIEIRKASDWICREVETGTKSATHWAIRLIDKADQIDTALSKEGGVNHE